MPSTIGGEGERGADSGVLGWEDGGEGCRGGGGVFEGLTFIGFGGVRCAKSCFCCGVVRQGDVFNVHFMFWY